MDKKKKAVRLLDKFKFPHAKEGVYELGCSASLLNIHAQQRRAFNLIWALQTAGKLPKGSSVAVIGGGVAGLTVAIGLAAAGAQVTVYEREHRHLNLQRDNFIRVVHPNISSWPALDAGYPATDLPFMNWTAGKVALVVDELEKQWLAAVTVLRTKSGPLLQLKPNCKVKSIKWHEKSGKVKVIDTKNQSKSFSVAILAVGYGVETAANSTTRSYWRNDDLSQPIFDYETPKQYLVSGTGDGGLTEVLRLKLSNFDQDKFFDAIMDNPLLKNAVNTKTSKDWDALWKTESADIQKFEALFPMFFGKDNLRSDTEVILNGKKKCPFEETADRVPAQILHRLCAKLLLCAKKIEYAEGRLSDLIAKYPDHEIVERHGSDSALKNLFGLSEKDLVALKTRWFNNDQYEPVTHEQHFDADFLADELMTCHYEAAYEVGFGLSSFDAAKTMASKILKKLSSSTAALNTVSERSFKLSEKLFNLRTETLELVTFSGADPHTIGVGMPWRSHRPRSFPGLVLHTKHRRVIDALLDDVDLPYHLYRIHFTNALPANIPLDLFINMDTHTYIINLVKQRRCIEIHRANGMHQAHKLLRMPVLAEVMGNTWPVTRIHGMGWAVGNTSKTNREQIRGNQLLKR